MIIRDVAFIYKKKNNLYYAISEKHGKIILANLYFIFTESTHSYCFVEYEYLKSDYQIMINQNKVILKVQDMALLALLSYRSSWYKLIFILNFFFDYFLEFLEAVPFFKSLDQCFFIESLDKEQLMNFVFFLLKTMQIISEDEMCEAIDQFSLIKKKYVERAPFLKNYIDAIFSQFLAQ